MKVNYARLTVIATPTIEVRCLGPGKEHTFMSKDKFGNRMCPSCQNKISLLRVGKADSTISTTRD